MERYVAVRPFARHLDTIADTLRNDGARLVLVTQPSLFKPDLLPEERRVLLFGRQFCMSAGRLLQQTYPSPESLRHAHETFNAVVRRVAGSKHVVLADADAAMPKTIAHFIDDVHYTQEGAQVLAGLVSDQIVASDSVADPPSVRPHAATQPSGVVARDP